MTAEDAAGAEEVERREGEEAEAEAEAEEEMVERREEMIE